MVALSSIYIHSVILSAVGESKVIIRRAFQLPAHRSKPLIIYEIFAADRI